MKIRFLSDLRLEIAEEPEHLPSIGEDLVVLAGDIHEGVEGIRWAQRVMADRPVLYVMGNHEYYRFALEPLLATARELCKGSNVTLLEDSAVVMGGIRFIGATLWTDFELLGQENQKQSMQLAKRRVSDYKRIIHTAGPARRPLEPADTLNYHRASRAFFENAINTSNEPVVVISHHGPYLSASGDSFIGDPLSPAYNSDLLGLMRDPVKAWIFGHTGRCIETWIRQTLVVSNQRGYGSEAFPGFRWDRCIEVLPDGSKLAAPVPATESVLEALATA